MIFGSNLMLQKSGSQVLDCPACGHATLHRYLYSMNASKIFQCTACELGRAQTQNFDPAAYYTKQYFSGQSNDGYADYLGSENVLGSEFARTIEFIRPYCSQGRLLELGCAYGFFLQQAKRVFDVSGIELANEAADYCRRSGLNVLTGTADEVNMRQIGNVDAIVLLDVIEHLPDPHKTLGLCESYLRPGGIIVLTTGDFGSLLSRLTGSHWRLMTPPQHQWFFTRESMRRLAETLKLQLVSLDHPWKIVPLSLIIFQARRMLGFHNQGKITMSRLGLPVNLFDAMRIVLRKPMRP